MEPFTEHSGVVAPLPWADVDTDQIIPKQFLARIERTGFGPSLFHDWRFDRDGRARPDFVLNRPELAGASVLVALDNFGCGSSREHAAWALVQYGFRVVIAPGFADIFRENADQNGLLVVELERAHVDTLLARADTEAPFELTVDLRACRVHDRAGWEVGFEIDSFRRTCLLGGLDRIARTLRHEADIAAYEARR